MRSDSPVRPKTILTNHAEERQEEKGDVGVEEQGVEMEENEDFECRDCEAEAGVRRPLRKRGPCDPTREEIEEMPSPILHLGRGAQTA